ncbi:MAG: histidine kinase [Actinomycetota bacterium]|nr:histidine kinase [Actinomycetota bacterium]
MNVKARWRPTPDHAGVGLSGLIPDPRASAAVFLAGLGVSVWVSVGGLADHAGVAVLAALALAGAAWLVLASASTGPLAPAAAAVMGAAGGMLAVSDRYGLIFVGVGAAAAAVMVELLPAAVVSVAGPAAFAVTAGVQGRFPGRLDEAATVCLAGLVAGSYRRAVAERAKQAALLATARQRSEVASQQAELAAERVRLGRELHDVLAHTLGALSIQLTALDTLARDGTGRVELLAQVERSRQLVRAGLDEARQAVRALREDTVPLAEQLEQLCVLHDAELEVSGAARPITAEVRLALYRVAQEGLTNAARHAPGSDVAVRLAFEPGEVAVSVRNSRARLAKPAQPGGGGYGLSGMRERVLQAGGQLQAGPVDGGWQVTARIPA